MRVHRQSRDSSRSIGVPPIFLIEALELIVNRTNSDCWVLVIVLVLALVLVLVLVMVLVLVLVLRYWLF